MGKINLLYVITKLELGGAQKHVITLIKHLDASRYNVFLFTAHEGLLMEEALSIKGLVLKRSKFLERSINPLKDILAFFEILRFINTHNIEIVHTHSSKAGILGRLAAKVARVGIVIHTVHGWSFNQFQPLLLKQLYLWLEKIAAKFTDQFIVVSQHDRQEGLEQGIGTSQKYRLIRIGIERESFVYKDNRIRESLGLGTNDLVVGMIACLKPQKAPHDFITLAFYLTQMMAPKGFDNLKFLLVGDGLLRSRIEKNVDRLHLIRNVLLTGWRNDIPRILAAIDIFVLTSLWEGLPVSVLEAMAAGKPMVVTNTGGVSEIIIENENGFMVLPHAMQEMAEKVALLIGNASLRAKIGNSAQATLTNQFSTAVMIKDIRAIYDTLLETKRRSYAR